MYHLPFTIWSFTIYYFICRMRKYFLVVIVLVLSLSAWAGDTIRVLCVGNSFSWDAVEQELYPLAKSQGVELLIGNLYYGGCSLHQHDTFMLRGLHKYSFRLIRGGERTLTEHSSLYDALGYTQWDYISFQQASHDSGKKASYEPYLSHLIDTVRRYQPHAQLCWMQTWSYSRDAKHPGYPYYGSDQDVMTDSIMSATRMVLRRHPDLLLVPCGAAIQYARQSLGDVLCRDGYHLHYDYGRYTASCVWYEVLTGKSVIGAKYRNPKMTREQQIQTQKAAHRAVKEPFLEPKTAKNAKK